MEMPKTGEVELWDPTEKIQSLDKGIIGVLYRLYDVLQHKKEETVGCVVMRCGATAL